MEDLLFVDEVAKELRVTRKTVYDWMRDGRLDFVVVGGRRRIPRTSIALFIKQGRSGNQDLGGVESENKLAPVFVGG